MLKFNGKEIFSIDFSAANRFRKEYLDSVNRFIEKGYSEGAGNRKNYVNVEIVANQEKYREAYLKMIGQPVWPYPSNVPNAKTEYVGSDDFCDISYLQIEVMPDFWFFGILMQPKGAEKAPLVIAQHGGGSSPEICCDFLGESNYSYFTKHALERGMAVFAPQLLLWKFDIETGEAKTNVDLPFKRGDLDNKLKHLGLSITGLEVFCIRRSIDYLVSLDNIDEQRIGMMGLSYGGYFTLHTAAADTRIKSAMAAAFFNDREKVTFGDWRYNNAANLFLDAEVAALCAPRRLILTVGKSDPVFDYLPSVAEGERAKEYYSLFGAQNNFRYDLWEGGHRFNTDNFDFFFSAI